MFLTPCRTGRAGTGTAASTRPPARSAAELFSWKEVILTTLRSLILYLILPLVAIHLWIAVARQGLGDAFRNIKRVLSRALSPGAVLVYAIGFVFFVVIPYLLITVNFLGHTAWREISLPAGACCCSRTSSAGSSPSRVVKARIRMRDESVKPQAEGVKAEALPHLPLSVYSSPTLSLSLPSASLSIARVRALRHTRRCRLPRLCEAKPTSRG